MGETENGTDRPYDIAIYGASGFTGKFVAAEAVRTCTDKKIAIAGRNKEKLLMVFDHIEKECSGWNMRGDVGVIIADNKNDDSIREMCRQSRIVINCVGPFRWYGEQVAKACIEMSTHYVDISGEPEYLQMLQLKYHEEALNKGVHIVGACGFDSIPADVGTELFRDNFPGELTAIESFLHLYGPGRGNYGTYLTLIHSVKNKDIQAGQKKILFKDRVPYEGKKLASRYPGFVKNENKYILPFLGSDPSVVKRTQMFENKKHGQMPIQYRAYFGLKSIFHLIGFTLFGIIMFTLTKFNFGVKLLEDYPSIFSFGVFVKEGPSIEDLKKSGFKLVLRGQGYSKESEKSASPDTKATLVVRGPDAGYTFTSMCVVASAKTILEDPLRNRGGCLTTGSAFKGTDLVKRLVGRGVKFELTHNNQTKQLLA